MPGDGSISSARNLPPAVKRPDVEVIRDVRSQVGAVGCASAEVELPSGSRRCESSTSDLQFTAAR
jgi:hypothetical protein